MFPAAARTEAGAADATALTAEIHVGFAWMAAASALICDTYVEDVRFVCCCMHSVEKYQILVNILDLCKGEDREQGHAGQELGLHSDRAEKTAGFLKRMSREREKGICKQTPQRIKLARRTHCMRRIERHS